MNRIKSKYVTADQKLSDYASRSLPTRFQPLPAQEEQISKNYSYEETRGTHSKKMSPSPCFDENRFPNCTKSSSYEAHTEVISGYGQPARKALQDIEANKNIVHLEGEIGVCNAIWDAPIRVIPVIIDNFSEMNKPSRVDDTVPLVSTSYTADDRGTESIKIIKAEESQQRKGTCLFENEEIELWLKSWENFKRENNIPEGNHSDLNRNGSHAVQTVIEPENQSEEKGELNVPTCSTHNEAATDQASNLHQQGIDIMPIDNYVQPENQSEEKGVLYVPTSSTHNVDELNEAGTDQASILLQQSIVIAPIGNCIQGKTNASNGYALTPSATNHQLITKKNWRAKWQHEVKTSPPKLFKRFISLYGRKPKFKSGWRESRIHRSHIRFKIQPPPPSPKLKS